MKDIKSIFAAFLLSLSRVEKEGLSAALEDEGVHHQTMVKKDSIKLVSSRRFNDIIEKADEAYRRRHGHKFNRLQEQRGIGGTILRSFKNQRNGHMFESIDGDSNVDYKFKTSNELGMFADSAYILQNYGEEYTLHFVVNLLNENARLRNKDFSDLEYFGIQENARTYLYGINGFKEKTIIGDEMGVVFDVFLIKDGELSDKINDNEIVMRKSDLINPNTTMWPTKRLEG